MPLVDLHCTSCGKDFKDQFVTSRELQIIINEVTVPCECGGELHRLPPAPGVINVTGYSSKNGYSRR